MNLRFIRKNRIVVSRIAAIILLMVFVFTRTDIENTFVRVFMNSAGLLLITVGAFGRIWSSMFICGYKRRKIIDTGPYAITRNPLYLFSFIAALGISLTTLNVIFIILMIMLFIGYYVLVVISEEKNLERIHGKPYLDYLANTPRFFPNFKKFVLPERYDVDVKTYSRAFLDAVWFFVAYVMIDIVKLLQQQHVIPLVFG
ncbi:MAG: isoprenylcysteine carboxylmethyltransferase family protein [Desulfobacterales bacterium]